MSHRKVSTVMSTDVATVRADTPFKDIVRVLEQRDVSAVPVVDDARHVLGVVSQADLLVKQGTQEPEWTRSPVSWWRRRRNTRRAEGNTAGELMTEPALTVDAHVTVAHAAREMARHDVKRLPVVGADGTLAGIVSRKDVLGVFLRKDEDICDDIVRDVFELGLGVTVSPANLTVAVHNGHVTVEGQVEMKSQLPLAEAMIRHTDGVVDVTMSLTYRHDDTRPHIPPPMSVDITHEPWQ